MKKRCHVIISISENHDFPLLHPEIQNNAGLESRGQLAHSREHGTQGYCYERTIFEAVGTVEVLFRTPETLQTAQGTLTVTPVGSSGSFRDQTVRFRQPLAILSNPRFHWAWASVGVPVVIDITFSSDSVVVPIGIDLVFSPNSVVVYRYTSILPSAPPRWWFR